MIRSIAAVALASVIAWWGPAEIVTFNTSGPQREARIEKNWGLHNGRALSGIEAPAAWKLLKGVSKVNVAVIDTGIDGQHPDLAKVTSHFGWDFNEKKKATSDGHGHGTHIAGIIDIASNGRAFLIPVVYYAETNTGAQNLKKTVAAIRWAVDHGAKVINYSGGGPEFAEEEYLALKYAETHNVLVVAAAGNERSDSDVPENYYYPAAYRLANIIVVAATDIGNHLIRSSNWGKTKVDVAAPGENIFSTLPNSRYGFMTGTSQATAFVTATAVMILTQRPKLKPSEVKEIIRATVDPIAELKDKVASGGRVNAEAAIRSIASKKEFASESP
jgi:subtilisin family serine protease